MATGVVEAELARLDRRLPDLDAAASATRCAHAVRRVADKLLHQPTVRVKELADEDGAVTYAEALRRAVRPRPRAPSTPSPGRRGVRP